jgi:hypothetical protein
MQLIRFSVVPLCLLALALAGCAGSDKDAPKLSCPVAFIAPNLDSYTVPRAGAASAANPNDIAFGVKLTDVKSSCRQEASGVRVTTQLSFIVARNDPNLRQGDFSYFVAVADARQNILAKQNFALRVSFASQQKEVRVAEEITEHLPVKDVSVVGSYGVIVGLQISKEQLDLNRKRS